MSKTYQIDRTYVRYLRRVLYMTSVNYDVTWVSVYTVNIYGVERQVTGGGKLVVYNVNVKPLTLKTNDNYGQRN